MRSRAAVLLLPLLLSSPLVAQDVSTSRGIEVELHGIASGSLYLQDAEFGLGNGQKAQFVNRELAGWWHGGDVRSTRLSLAVLGPRVHDDWRANAHVEMDFFGGFPGAGAFGDEQPQPRLRSAWVELTDGPTALRAGQDWSLTLGNVPISTSHIGFPLGWGSGGFIGWRFPGIWLSRRLTDGRSDLNPRLRLAVLQNSWSDAVNPELPAAGNAGVPQLEARLDLGRGGDDWSAYVAGHWDRKDLNGVRGEGEPEPEEADLDSWAVVAGAAATAGPLFLHGNVYSGRAMGHHFAHVVQFGDIRGWGAWAQAGLSLSRRWSLWGFAGMDDPEDEDVTEAGGERLRSWLIVPMLRWRSGPYALGFEWLHARTSFEVPAADEEERIGNQLLFSVRLDF